jgi:hypothetical protein
MLTFSLGVTASLRVSGTTRGLVLGFTWECFKVTMTTWH